jgi:hypothetical protein
MTEELKKIGCTCHTNAPCVFCTSLTEEEADIMWNGGMEALKKYWKERESFYEG